MSQTPIDVPKLELESAFGFNGEVPQGLKVHPDMKHLIYPLGDKIVIENLSNHKQDFLQGHTNNVTCVAVSKSGRYIASGQQTHMGFKADVIVWDYEEKCIYATFTLHKVKVECLAFSPNDRYLATLGGQDDGSIVIWDIARRDAICGSPAQVQSAGTTYVVRFANNDENMFVTAGNNTIRIWSLDVTNRKIRPVEAYTGNCKRIVKCLEISKDNSEVYCGTTTGDILAISTKTHKCLRVGPEKGKFSQGIVCIHALEAKESKELLIGAGDGTVSIVNSETFKRTKKTQSVAGAVTSIALRGMGHQFFVATNKCQMYKFEFHDFTSSLICTASNGAILDVAFPYQCSELCATCAKDEIKIWNLNQGKELLRIAVPNIICRAIDFTRDGTCIVSAWIDGKIRLFKPESGKLMYTIPDAHNKGVSAIACIHEEGSKELKIVSGGSEGQVRVWTVQRRGQMTSKLLAVMKEHTSEVTCIKVRENGLQCVTSSADGTCIIWDLTKQVRSQIIFASTMFKCVNYSKDECQIITSGSDRKIGYWESYDGAQIRELEGCKSGEINGMDISPDGRYIASGGEDKLIKVWLYDEGEEVYVGIGHCGTIRRLKISPDQRRILSVSDDGGLFVWKFPFPSAYQ